METYILLVFLKYYESNSATAQEFNSQASCEHAKINIEQKVISKAYPKSIALCVKK